MLSKRANAYDDMRMNVYIVDSTTSFSVTESSTFTDNPIWRETSCSLRFQNQVRVLLF